MGRQRGPRRGEIAWKEGERRIRKKGSRAFADAYCAACGGRINAGAPVKYIDSGRDTNRPPALFHPGQCYEQSRILAEGAAQRRREAGE